MKHPLVKKLGLEVRSEMRLNFDQTERYEVNTVSADDLESILQSAPFVYFSKIGDELIELKTKKTELASYVGILIGQTAVPKPCAKCEPEFHDEVTFCKVCGRELRRKYE